MNGLAENEDAVGGQENRMSLNPNDERWPGVLNWQDGQQYTLTNVKVRQISPGEFEVLGADAPETADQGEEAPTTPESDAKGEHGGFETGRNYPNPAVAGLM